MTERRLTGRELLAKWDAEAPQRLRDAGIGKESSVPPAFDRPQDKLGFYEYGRG